MPRVSQLALASRSAEITFVSGIARYVKKSTEIAFSNFGRMHNRARAVDGVELVIALARGSAQFNSPARTRAKSDRVDRRAHILLPALWRGLWGLRADPMAISVGVSLFSDGRRQAARDVQRRAVFSYGALLWRDRCAVFGSTLNSMEIGRVAGLYAVVFLVAALFGHGWVVYLSICVARLAGGRHIAHSGTGEERTRSGGVKCKVQGVGCVFVPCSP